MDLQKAVTVINDETFTQETSDTSTQGTQRVAVILVFTKLQDCPFNLYSDSGYDFPAIENRYSGSKQNYHMFTFI